MKTTLSATALALGTTLSCIMMINTTAFALPSPPEAGKPSTAPSASSGSSSAAKDSSASRRQPGGPMNIVLDPGHGGHDTGAVRGHLKESEIALKVSSRLAELLRADPRFKVTMTRDSDQKLTLPQRTQIAQDAKADLFVSIHLNSSNDPRAHGKEFYFQNQLPVDEESMFIASRENAESAQPADREAVATGPKSEQLSAKSDLKRILEDLHRNERIHASSELSQILYETWVRSDKSHRTGSRSIRQAPFYVVSNVTVPSVLVELGFLSNPQEGPRLAQTDYQADLANSLYTGLVKFKETMDKDRAETLKSADAF